MARRKKMIELRFRLFGRRFMLHVCKRGEFWFFDPNGAGINFLGQHLAYAIHFKEQN